MASTGACCVKSLLIAHAMMPKVYDTNRLLQLFVSACLWLLVLFRQKFVWYKVVDLALEDINQAFVWSAFLDHVHHEHHHAIMCIMA